MIEHVLHVLWVQTLVLSATVLVIGCSRRAVAHRFGAEAAYLAWALMPVAALAAALPHRAQEAPLLPAALVQRVPAWPTVAPVAQPVGGIGAATIAFAAWVSIAALLVVAVAWRQRRFHAQLAHSDRLPDGSGPAVLGIVRPRVVLPADFESRFDATERGLMLAHEAVHLRRRDNAWNLLACAFLVAHWFNPLAWLAWRWMRFDQELSCDAAVLGATPSGDSPRYVQAYAAALLKVQGVALRPVLATSWQSTHPLVERVCMLKRHALSSSSLRTGRGLVAGAIVLAGAVSYASQPPAPPAPVGSYTTFLDDGHVSTQVTLAVDGLPPRFTQIGEGKERRIRFQAQPETGLADWMSLEVHAWPPMKDGRVRISSLIRDEAKDDAVGKPSVIVRMNEPARVELGDVGGHHTVSITYVPRPTGYVPPGSETPPPALPAPVVMADKPAVMTTIEVTDTLQRAASSGTTNKTEVRSTFSVMSHLGEPAAVRIAEGAQRGQAAGQLDMGVTVSRLDGDRLQIDARVNGNAAPAATATPRLVVRDGERADVRVKSDDGSHEIAISFQPRLVPDVPHAPRVLSDTPPAPPALAPPAPPAVPSTTDLPAPPAPPQRPS